MFRSNQQLTDYLADFRILRTPSIIRAFRKIDRGDFVPPKHSDEKYGDFPLSIGCGQTISQPTTVAFMLELLQPQKGEKILDIGSGSGWTTALLGEITGETGKVFGVEIIPELIKFGQKNLKKYNFSWATIQPAEKKLGLAAESPFDKILVSATANKLPEELINQLKTNGRLVMPVQNSVWKIDKIPKGKIKKQEFPGFAFVPLKQ